MELNIEIRKKIEQDFEKYVQGIFNTPYGKEFFIILSILSEYFENSLVVANKLKPICDDPLMYLEAQRDLVRKMLNCLTSQQFAELRDGVLSKYFPKKDHKEKK